MVVISFWFQSASFLSTIRSKSVNLALWNVELTWSRNKKLIYIAPLESKVQPLEIPVRIHFCKCVVDTKYLQLAKGGEAFWINSRTVAHVVEGDEALELYALDIKFEAQTDDQAGSLTAPTPPTLIGKFPTKSATNFRFSPASGQLVFSAYVYPDGNLTAVKKHDDEWESRGNSAFVYDTTYVRHWDTWQGAKKPALFSVRLALDPERKWIFGTHFINLLKGTGHVSTEHHKIDAFPTHRTVELPCGAFWRNRRFRCIKDPCCLHHQGSKVT